MVTVHQTPFLYCFASFSINFCPVQSQKIEVSQVTKLYIEVFKKFFEIQPEIFFTTDLGLRIGLTKNPQEANLRQAAPINDTYFIESNIDNNGKFDRIKQALTIFESQDELMIKYAKS